MNSKPFIIAEILKKSLVNHLTDEETHALKEWRGINPINEKLYESFKRADQIEIDLILFESIDLDKSWDNLQEKQTTTPRQSYKNFIKIWIPIIAACLVVFFYLFFIKNDSDQDNSKIIAIQSMKHKNDIKPASAEATLILDDGESILLNNNKNVAITGNIAKNNDELAYKQGVEAGSRLKFNTLIVPKGGYYKMELSDGTKVWVNAMSQLKFPELFGSSERQVQLEGEAYFEVAKDSKRPFIVKTKEVDIEVIGTHFNVNAYSGKVRTTLEEGKVKLFNSSAAIFLQPGEFGESLDGNFNKGYANLNKDLSWHNNEFYFQNDPIQLVIDQLSKWYDLDVKFGKYVKRNKLITGSIDRNIPLSQVLEMLEYVSDLEFKINGSQLIIENK